MDDNKFDILIWAHSDKAGGTEMACVLALELIKVINKEKKQLSVAIVTPYPSMVDEFYEYESDPKPGIINIPKLLRIETTKDGSVDPDGTYNLLKNDAFKDLSALIGHCQYIIQNHIKEGNTLVISCGEPIALKVACNLNLKRIIVTDHLLTFTVRQVLEKGGLLDSKVASLMTEFENFDRLALEAYLSPVEFTSLEYGDYLAQGGLPCIPIPGLFYEPINRDILNCIPPYKDLYNSTSFPIVIVFGGSGFLWDEIFIKLHDKAKESEFQSKSFAILLRDVQNSSVVKGVWRLYVPGKKWNSEGTVMDDPGRLMYWYAACQLVVVRGGLAAQQVLATMLSDIEEAPQILFIEEPGHPQIESERLNLYRLGLIQTRTLRRFSEDPLEIIEEILSKPIDVRLRAFAHYGQSALQNLTRSLLQKYF